MKKEEVRTVLMQEADKCQRFADKCRDRGDSNLSLYWLGKRRGLLDAIKYLDRIEETEMQRKLRLSKENSHYGGFSEDREVME